MSDWQKAPAIGGWASAPPTESALSAEVPEVSWGDTFERFLSNLPSNARKVGEGLLSAVLHPAGTLSALGGSAGGGLSMLAGREPPPPPEALAQAGLTGAYNEDLAHEAQNQEAARAIGREYGEYGSIEGIKNRLANKPAETLLDVFSILPAVRAAAGAAGAGARTAGRGIADYVGALHTHTGGESIQTAARAGMEGGEKGAAFLEALRGETPSSEIVSDATRALGEMRAERSAEYQASMLPVKANKEILDWGPIDKAWRDAYGVSRFKGEVINEPGEAAHDAMTAKLAYWRGLDPKEYHTPAGMDALKRSLDIDRQKFERGTPARLVADRLYSAVRGEIIRQAPEYADVMKSYEQASNLIQEIEGTLSVNPKALVDTKVRKLLSVMRQNANTNYGRRVELADLLVEHGATHLMEKLAGMTLDSWYPRGLGRLASGAVSTGVLALGNPGLLAALPLSSPKLAGYAAYGLGATARPLAAGFKATQGPVNYGAGAAIPMQATNIADMLRELTASDTADQRRRAIIQELGGAS